MRCPRTRYFRALVDVITAPQSLTLTMPECLAAQTPQVCRLSGMSNHGTSMEPVRMQVPPVPSVGYLDRHAPPRTPSNTWFRRTLWRLILCARIFFESHCTFRWCHTRFSVVMLADTSKNATVRRFLPLTRGHHLTSMRKQRLHTSAVRPRLIHHFVPHLQSFAIWLLKKCAECSF